MGHLRILGSNTRPPPDGAGTPVLRRDGPILLDLGDKIRGSTGVLVQAVEKAPTRFMTQQLDTGTVPHKVQQANPSITLCPKCPPQ